MDIGYEPLNMRTSCLTFNRKLNRLPKFLRFYLFLIFVFLAFTFSYYIFIVSKKNSILNSSVANDDTINNNLLIKTDLTDNHVEDKNQALINIQNPILEHFNDNQDDPSNIINNYHLDKFLTSEELKIASYKQNEQQKSIQEAILHSWQGYRKYAWGYDMLKPITKKGHNWFGIGLTILDSMDTLIIAGLENEYQQALEWVTNDLSFSVNEDVNCFETTIRALAGLLSAYHLTNEKILLDKAADLGSRLIHCFDSPSKTVPYSDVNLKTKLPKAPSWSSDSSLSEVSSVQLEFRDLAYEINDKSYEEKSFQTSKHLHEQVEKRFNYLMPMYINPFSGHLVSSTITLGARADSYYEYLYKQYIQTKIRFLLDDYMNSIQLIKKRLMRTTNGKLQLTYIGEILNTDPGSVSPKMDHLVCFLSGTLALGYYHENARIKSDVTSTNHSNNVDLDQQKQILDDHLKMAEDLARTCHFMYNLTETGLAPEIGHFGIQNYEKEYYIKPRDTHNLLRPEFVESLFFLYHITGQQKYRDWGRQVFEAFQKYTRINSGGYTTIDDVRHPQNVKPKDMMESFWLAETLKYLYLLFMDNKKIIYKLLNSYIFNTEGHLLLIRK